MRWTSITLLAAASLAFSACGPPVISELYPDGTPPAGTDRPMSGNGMALPTLAATARSAMRIDLRWTDNSTTVTGFGIERSTTNTAGSFTQVATVGAEVRAYSDESLDAASTYFYRIAVTNVVGGIRYTPVVSIATLLLPVDAFKASLWTYVNGSNLATGKCISCHSQGGQAGFSPHSDNDYLNVAYPSAGNYVSAVTASKDYLHLRNVALNKLAFRATNFHCLDCETDGGEMMQVLRDWWSKGEMGNATDDPTEDENLQNLVQRHQYDLYHTPASPPPMTSLDTTFYQAKLQGATGVTVTLDAEGTAAANMIALSNVSYIGRTLPKLGAYATIAQKYCRPFVAAEKASTNPAVFVAVNYTKYGNNSAATLDGVVQNLATRLWNRPATETERAKLRAFMDGAARLESTDPVSNAMTGACTAVAGMVDGVQ